MRPKVIVIAGLILVAACSAALAGQTHGRVQSRQKPVRGARVTLDQDTATTDSTGGFALARAVVGRLRVTALGYSPFDSVLSASAGDTLVITLRAIQALPSVEVKAGLSKPARYASTSRYDTFYERRASGTGKFFTREDIDRSDRPLIIDLLKDIPGVRVNQPRRDSPVSLRFARCTAAMGGLPPAFSSGGGSVESANRLVAVFVDGAQLSTEYGVAFLDALKSFEVEAMEVYQGVSQLPGEARGNACAAIYIWTRFMPVADTGRRTL